VNNKNYGTTTAFVDLLFNLVLSFVSLFLLTMLLINPPKKDSTINSSAKYIIAIQWQDNSSHDVDLWLTDGKHRVYFKNKQTDTMFLERDDLGADIPNHNIHFVPKNEESVSIRIPQPGTYTAAVHFYKDMAAPHHNPTKDMVLDRPIVKWALIKVLSGSMLASGTVSLEMQGDEKTLIRFSLTEEGEVTNIDTINSYPFINKAL
jgi:hypothetical protein